MEIGNNIVVKLYLFNQAVEYDIADGSIILYDHSNLYPGNNSSSVFTGVKLEVHEKVKIVCEDLKGNNLNHSLFNGYVCVQSTGSSQGKPLCLVRFVPKREQKNINSFHGRFIKIN